MPPWLLWWRPPCLLRRVIVNLANDPATGLRGVLWQARGSWLVLRDVEKLERDERGDVTADHVDGEAIVHRSNVAFVQVLP